MGTKRNPGAYDCHGKAAPDEPIFTLRANDPLAPLLVRRWAYLYKSRKEKADAYGSDAHSKYMEAHDCATAMERWKKEQPEEPTKEAAPN